MPSSRFICTDCGLWFSRIPVEWHRDEVLICPNCGSHVVVVSVDPRRRWRAVGHPRFVRGSAAGERRPADG